MSHPPLIIGHRGASAHAPENTLAAFQMALDAGAGGIEFDVQLSKDGVPVIIHDRTLLRTGMRPDRVADLTVDQLSNVDVGSWFNAKFPHRARTGFANERVPTLARVLDLLKDNDRLIYIELKCDETDYAQLAETVCDSVRDSPLLPQIIIKSFKLAAIPLVRNYLPAVQTAALFEPSILDLVRRRRRIIDIARKFDAQQISLHHSLVTKKLVSLAVAAEMPVTIWTVENSKWLMRGQKLGIRAIITNDPARLIAAKM